MSSPDIERGLPERFGRHVVRGRIDQIAREAGRDAQAFDFRGINPRRELERQLSSAARMTITLESIQPVSPAKREVIRRIGGKRFGQVIVAVRESIGECRCVPNTERLARLLAPETEGHRACTPFRVWDEQQLVAFGLEVIGGDPIARGIGLTAAPTLEVILVDEMNRNGSGTILAGEHLDAAIESDGKVLQRNASLANWPSGPIG